MGSTTSTVVVTDVARPLDLVRCVAQVRRTVPDDVEVVVLSSRKRPLQARSARAVRTVVTRTGELFSAAVSTEAARERLVVVARSDCRFSTGWFQTVQARCGASPNTVGMLGGDDPHLLVFPESVVSTDTPQLAWAPVAGVDMVRRSPKGVPPRSTTISASLIVKDEEQVIADCLASLRGVVDEVVVYDTGSGDRTVEIAEEHGAIVHRGYWDDHFGNARNRALAYCTTEWVLHIDADEIFTGDPVALRARLAEEPADLLRAVVVSTEWSGATEGQEIRPVRVFRREKVRWSGSLHEHVIPRPGVTGVTLSPICADVRLMHSGYHRTAFVEKSKVTRNLDIARAAAEAASPGDPESSTVWSNYGRALASVDRAAAALEALEHLFADGANSTAAVAGARSAVQLLAAHARWDQLDRWLKLLEQHGEASGNLAVLRARRSLAGGDLDAAESALDTIGGDLDVWGAEHDRASVRSLRVDLASARGQTFVASAMLRDEMINHPETVDVAALLNGTLNAGGSLRDLAVVCPESFLARSLRVAFELPLPIALEWFEALIGTHPGDSRAMVAACVAASRADLPTALTWSLRTREAGLPSLCPLRDFAQSDDTALVDRGLAWAILADVFAEPDALVHLDSASSAMTPDQRSSLARALATLTPGVASGAAGAS